jgi:GTP cyclohydrolase III
MGWRVDLQTLAKAGSKAKEALRACSGDRERGSVKEETRQSSLRVAAIGIGNEVSVVLHVWTRSVPRSGKVLHYRYESPFGNTDR